MRTVFDLICYVCDDSAVKFEHVFTVRMILPNMIQGFLKTESETDTYLP